MYDPRLNSFIQVADKGSFSRAADILYLSSTPVIKQINSLEQELETQLFYRTPQGLSLTEGGKSFYQDAQYMLRYAGAAKSRAKSAMENHPRTIRIGTSLLNSGQFLARYWPEIHRLCPSLNFQLVNFENTWENAVNILKNLGSSIDVVAGIYDENILLARECRALRLSMDPICCALPIYHPLAQKKILTVEDLYGQQFMMIRRGWNQYADKLRNEIESSHPQIHISDFSLYSIEAFNQCENQNCLMMTVERWGHVHPLLKTLPIDWPHAIPFGILYPRDPSQQILLFLEAVKQVLLV